MVEEGRGAGVEGFNLFHLVLAEFEVEHIEVFGHPLALHGLRDHHDAALDVPADNDLSDGFAVAGSDRAKRLVVENTVLTFGEGGPALGLDFVLFE